MRAKVPGIITSSSQPFRRKKPGGRSTKANVRWCENNIALQIPVRHVQHPGPAFGLAAVGSPLTGTELRTLRAERAVAESDRLRSCHERDLPAGPNKCPQLG